MADISIQMNPEAFARARAAVIASKDVVSHSESSDRAGRFATKQVALMYEYSPQVSLLGITVLSKSGLARFASNDQIRQRLVALLAQA